MKKSVAFFFVVAFVIQGSGGYAAFGKEKSSTQLNFDGEEVNGINRKPLDSVSQISEKNRDDREHLYRKRDHFSDQDRVILRGLEFHP